MDNINWTSGKSYWLDTLATSPCAPLKGNPEAEITIIGGGLTGLSAAYHLVNQRPDLDIVLVEAGSIGSGASGRNTGMVGPGIGDSISALCRQFGDRKARQIYQATLDAFEMAIKIIEKEALSCDLEITGQVKAALTERQAEKLKKRAETYDRLGFEVAYLNQDDIAEVIGVGPYIGGLYYPRIGLINPAKLCRELKEVILARGVRVYEKTPVRSVNPGNPARLRLDEGVLTTKRVILATNAYTAHLKLLEGQVIPIHTHVLVTERLTDRQLSSLGWPRRDAIVGANNCFNYFRLTPDNRIMFGGGRPVYRASAANLRAGATEVSTPRIWETLRGEFYKTFPSLNEVKIIQGWSGPMGFTLDRLPLLGELSEAPDALFAGGWNGHGLTLAMSSGATIANLALGKQVEEPILPWMRGRTTRIPADPARALGLSAYLASLAMYDRLETFQADRRK